MKKSLFIMCCIAGVIVFSADVRGEEETVSSQISGLLSKSLLAGDVAKAREIVEQAVVILADKGSGVSKLERGFLRADIQQAWGRVLAGAVKSGEKGFAAEAKQVLLDSVSQYESLKGQAEGVADTMEDRLKWGQIARSRRWKETRGLESRANYSVGWAMYGLGQVADGAYMRRMYLEDGIEYFRGFTDGGYRDNPIIADCFVGEGLCLYELGRYAEVAQLLDVYKLPLPKDDMNFFKRVSFIRIKAFAGLGSDADVELAGRFYFDKIVDKDRLDGAELEIGLEWARSLARLAADEDRNPYYRTHKRRLGSVSKIFGRHGGEFAAMVAAITADSGVVTPFGSLIKAREFFGDGQYDDALTEAQMGLEAEDGADLSVMADLEYVRLACLVKLGRFSDAFDAGDSFAGKYNDDKRIDDVIAVTLDAGMRAAAAGDVEAKRVLRFVEANAGEGEFLQQRGNLLIETGRFAEAADVLSKVKRANVGDDEYLTVLYSRGLAAYRLARRDGSGIGEGVVVLREFVDVYGGDQPKVCSAMVDVGLATAKLGLRSEKAEVADVFEVLELLEKMDCVGEDSAGAIAAVRIEGYVLSGDLAKAASEAQKVMSGETAGDEVVGALVRAGVEIENSYLSLVAAGDEIKAKETADRLVGIYRFLLETAVKSGSDEKIKILRRLARSLLWAGRYDDAIAKYELLLADDSAVSGEAISELAAAHEGAGRYGDAAKQWQVLVKGTAKQSEMWYEANWHVMWCLYEAGDDEQADRLFDYFQLKYGGQMDAKWKRRFGQLREDTER